MSTCSSCGYRDLYCECDHDGIIDYNRTEPERTTPAMSIPFTMTQDTITVVIDGKPFTTQAGTLQYHGLRAAIFAEDWASVPKHITLTGALQQWLGDKFVVDGDTISLDGAQLPKSLNTRIWEMARGGESPGPLFAFYERLARNPSKRSVDQLFDFLKHAGIPIEPDGTFLAYKGVQADFLDAHSGTFDNSPGQTHKMPRNQISDDPRHACHEGFHVGALSYAKNFASRTVIVRVDPEHVVSVPYDYSCQKMRVCEYTVIGQWVDTDASMPSTTFVPDVAPDAAPDKKYSVVFKGMYDLGGSTGVTHNLIGTIKALRAIMPGLSLRDGVDTAKGPTKCIVKDVDLARANAIVEQLHDAGATAEVEEQSDEEWGGDVEDLDDEVSDPDDATEHATARVRAAKPQPTVLTSKPTMPKAAAFNRMSPTKLIEQSIDDLRKYASAHLKIVGASKLPGGKSALVSAILKARKRRSR